MPAPESAPHRALGRSAGADPNGAVWHPYTQMQGAAPIEIRAARGAWLEAADGSRYLDAISSWWVTLHGHSEPRIATAIARQAQQLEQVILAGFTHRPAQRLARRLTALLPAGLNHVFFSDNGSTAVEVALKLAVQYWRHRGATGKDRIVALDHAYHGDTVGAMSVGAPSPFTAPFTALLFPVDRAHTAYCHRCPVGKRRESCRIDCLDRLDDLLTAGCDRYAAVIVEPLLQGAGGMIVQPPEFLAGVRRLCDRHGVLLVADEVLTGFGRTGTMFACEQANVRPDIICLSKGLTGGFLPLAATVATEEIHAAFLSDERGRAFFHGHSFCGNPLGCAAALASLEIFATEPVAARIDAIAARHRERLARLRGCARVADTRQAGTVAAIELESAGAGYLDEIGPRLQRFYLERGILLRPLGPVVYVLPPYCITADELDRVWDAIEQSLEL